MCLKNKIISVALCAIVSIAGVFVAGNNTVQAENLTTTSTTGLSLEQLQQLVLKLQEQISYIIQLLSQQNKPVCGNSVCETAKGETATSCPKDCGTASVCGRNDLLPGDSSRCTAAGGTLACVNTTCTATNSTNCVGSKCTCNCATTCGLEGATCNTYKCGTSTTGAEIKCLGGSTCCAGYTCSGWTNTCVKEAACAKQGETAGGGLVAYGTIGKTCCAGLSPINQNIGVRTDGTCGNVGADMSPICNVCGDGVCGIGENKCNCARDCGTITCVKENEITSDNNRPCCAGLVIKRINLDCATGTDCSGAASKFTCTKSACASEGQRIYASWSGLAPNTCCAELSPIANCTESGTCVNDGSSVCAKCGNGVCGIGENKANCPKDCGAATCSKDNQSCGQIINGQQINCCDGYECSYPAISVGSGNNTSQPITIGSGGGTSIGTPSQILRTGICVKKNSTCGAEGQQIFASWSGMGPNACCAGLASIANCIENGGCLNNGSSICAKCGNGVCGLGENKANCPKDCNTNVCGKTYYNGITATAKEECYKSGGQLYCPNTTCASTDSNCISSKCICGCTTPIVEPIVGGNCAYKYFAGKCYIDYVVSNNSGSTVNYTFSTTGPIDITGTFLQNTSQINPYKGSANAAGLTAGTTVECKLGVATSGTCTPIIPTFGSPIATGASAMGSLQTISASLYSIIKQLGSLIK